MDFEQIKQLLDLVRQHDLSEFEIEQEGLRLKVRKDLVPAAVAVVAPAAASPSSAPPASNAAGAGANHVSAGEAESIEDLESAVELAVVKSPIVGTFFRSPEPGAAAFVDVGSLVKKGQVLCIIEAMKLMNEIDSEYDGEVANIYVENGQPVQYGERLFAIRTR